MNEGKNEKLFHVSRSIRGSRERKKWIVSEDKLFRLRLRVAGVVVHITRSLIYPKQFFSFSCLVILSV